MAPPGTPTANEPKAADYYHAGRTELYEFAERKGHRFDGAVLNVGCAGGDDAPSLRRLGAGALHGIEPVQAASAAARALYDHVSPSTFDDYEWDGTRFSWVVFADVLEHMVDPGGALARVSEWLTPGGRVLVSVPNVRHLSVLAQVIFRGEWRYEAAGIMDATHLRFFTSRSIRRLLAETGYSVTDIGRYGMQPLTRTAGRLVPMSGELLLSQVFLVAERAGKVGIR